MGGTRSRLDLGDRCEGLPLLDLADDVAQVRGLTVHVREARELPAGAGGGVLVLRPPGDAYVLLAEVARVDVWAHELAHLIDNIDRRVGQRNRRTTDRRERFAGALAVLLLEWEPSTVAEAAPLIRQVRHAAA